MSEAGRITDLVRATVEPILLEDPMEPELMMGSGGPIIGGLFVLYGRSPILTEGWLMITYQGLNIMTLTERGQAEAVIRDMIAALNEQRNKRLQGQQ